MNEWMMSELSKDELMEVLGGGGNWGTVVGGCLQGAVIGAMTGPQNAAVGCLVGGIKGIFG